MGMLVLFHTGGFQTGYGIPASRLMANAMGVSTATAISSSNSCQGCVMRPSDTISVVAPAGGCGALSKTIRLEVSPSESAAAIIRGIVTSASAGPAVFNPVIHRLTYHTTHQRLSPNF